MSENAWRILCIDDDPDVLEILKATLGLEHEVVTASDGLEAMSMLDICDADFVVCDVMMPNMNGYQTVEAIRRHPRFMEIPVFFLTAEASREAAQRGFVSGANLYLTKPFDPMRVLENINYFLQESGLRPQAKRYSTEQVAREVKNLKPAASQDAAGATATSAPRVIVVTADAAQADRFSNALLDNYEVVRCADPLASLQQLFRYEPDILIVNPAIPQLSGWGLVQMIRRNPKLRRLPILLIEDEQDALDRRLVNSITKLPLIDGRAGGSIVLEAVNAVTREPGFNTQHKRASIEELQAEESKLRMHLAEEEQRRDQQQRVRRERFDRIQNFIDKNMQ